MSDQRHLPLWSVLRSAIALVWSAARREILLMLATQLVSAGAVVLQLLLAKLVLEELTTSEAIESFDTLGPVLLALLAVRVVASVSSIVRSETRLVVHERVSRHASLELYSVATAVDLGRYDDADFHDRLRRAQRNVDRRIWSTVWSLVALTTASLTLVALGAVMITTAPLVLAVAVVGALPLWWARRRNNAAMYRLSYEYTPDDRERSYLEQLLVRREPAAEIRAYDLGPTLVERIDLLFQDRVERMRDLVKRRSAWSASAAVVSNVLAIGSIAVLVQLIINGTISVADGGVALLALQQASSRLDSVSSSVGSLSGAAMFLEDYSQFVRQAVPPPELEALDGPELTEVRLEGVTFSYPGQSEPVLHDVDLAVKRGELVALVGENGSGKSTIAKLIAGLYPVDKGTIVWDTPDGPITDRWRIRRTLGLVFQHFLRFELSAADNVEFGDVRALGQRDRSWAALDAAGMASVIGAIPGGLEARLGRSFAEGAELSAGQWQRIGIARAFFRDAPLLLLDEPTASVDAKAEQELFDVVRSLQQGRGVVLITHRMATVREADRIYVLADGCVVEVGTHDELMAAGGHYAELYDIQARGYRD